MFFLVDAACPNRFSEAKEMLDDILDFARNTKIKVAFLGNKIDKWESVSDERLREGLTLNSN